jgi:hypothetical protein
LTIDCVSKYTLYPIHKNKMSSGGANARLDPVGTKINKFVTALNKERLAHNVEIKSVQDKEVALKEEKVVAAGKTRAVEKESRKLSLILSPLGDTADERCARDASLALRHCDSVGGLEELTKLIEASPALRAKKRAFARSERNRKYRQFLKDKGIVFGSVYAIEWDNLVDRSNNAALPVATSFVLVLPDCEALEDNDDSDPLKVHVRLALLASDAVNEAYLTIDAERMILADSSTISELCEDVFSDLNIGVLYAADGPGPECASIETYTKKIKEDSCKMILSHVKDSYDKINKYTSNPTRTAPIPANVGEKRTREGQ